MKKWHKSASFFEAMKYALRGIAYALTEERNVRIQFTVGTLVVFIMLFMNIPAVQVIIGILAITLVLALEMLNTAFELISDIVHPEYSIVVRNAKDVSAGAVLVAAIGASLIGMIIFLINVS